MLKGGNTPVQGDFQLQFREEKAEENNTTIPTAAHQAQCGQPVDSQKQLFLWTSQRVEDAQPPISPEPQGRQSPPRRDWMWAFAYLGKMLLGTDKKNLTRIFN